MEKYSNAKFPNKCLIKYRYKYV